MEGHLERLLIMIKIQTHPLNLVDKLHSIQLLIVICCHEGLSTNAESEHVPLGDVISEIFIQSSVINYKPLTI